MYRNRIVTILLVIFSISSFFFLFSYSEKDVFAQVSCPSNIDPDSIECLDYLTEQHGNLQKNQISIQKQIANEEYQQLSLQEKISYTENQITQTENEIKILEVEIAAHNIEIKLLEGAIAEMEDNVSLLSQEITQLKNSVNRRISESYKYSFVRPIELFLDIKNLSTVIRKSKYLVITRSQDKQYLEEYSKKVLGIKIEEKILAEKKGELQTARNEMDGEKVLLAESKENLSAQKTERESLLAQSKAKAAQLLAEMAQNKILQGQLDAQIAVLRNANIGTMVKKGPVGKGVFIGTLDKGRGFCGFSTGPHLHFGISSTATGQGFYANVPVWENGYLKWEGDGPVRDWDGKTPQPASSGSFLMPLTGSVVVTQNYHESDPSNFYAVDMVRADYFSTGGASVVAAAAGTLYRNKETICIKYDENRNCIERKDCGQDYVIIDHNNGLRTIYVHLTRE